ncbi:MAG: hypothetical protein PVH44_04035, partial [Desulfobacterales bacterium]
RNSKTAKPKHPPYGKSPPAVPEEFIARHPRGDFFSGHLPRLTSNLPILKLQPNTVKMGTFYNPPVKAQAVIF